MKRFGVSAAICLAVMIWGSVSHAEPSAVFAIGSGTELSCGEFIAAIGDLPPGEHRKMNNAMGVFVSEYKGYQEWLMGFMSGFNFAHAGDEKQQVANIDIAGMDLWMRNWCNKHPTKLVFDGVDAFINEMRSDAASRQR